MYGPNITTKALTQELSWAVKENYLRPIMIWGAPGLGKTRLTEQLARAEGLEHYLELATLMGEGDRLRASLNHLTDLAA